MEKPRIAILQNNSTLSELEPALERMGFIAEYFQDFSRLRLAMNQTLPNLLLVDENFCAGGETNTEYNVLRHIPDKICQFLVVKKIGGHWLFIDLFEKRSFQTIKLHDYFFKNLKSYSRRNLRLSVDLPAMLSHEHINEFTKITSLGTGGAFVKTGFRGPETGQAVNMTIPLLGQYAELNINGRVVYAVAPSQANNFIQGVGVSFDDPPKKPIEQIQEYLSTSLSIPPLTGSEEKPSSKAPFPAKKNSYTVRIAPRLN